jgi:ABC-type Zn uptake system ZnuABC Zn-binding protein ZnuA
MRLSIIAAIAFAVVGAGAVSCGGNETSSDAGETKVITTLPLFADFVRQIGGDRVEVSSLVPNGADPHTWEPSPSDVQRVAEAKIAFANGLDLEPSAVKIIEPNLGGSGRLVVLGDKAKESGAAVAQLPEGFREEGEEGTPGEGQADDPHLWMDPGNAKLYVAIIRDALAEADSAGKPFYDRNYASYISAINEAETTVRRQVSQIPETNRKLVTTHDAFGYFAGAFGLRIVAFVAPSPGREASPQDLAKLTEAMKAEAVPAVFVEPQIESEGNILRQAATDAGVEICTLYSDSLDDKVSSYIGMMRFNASELARCLGKGG